MKTTTLLRALTTGLTRLAQAPTRLAQAPTRTRHAPSAPTTSYPGDFMGPVRPVYEPRQDDRPDPGEVVWAWVPYEEDHRRGKDRPALIVGRDRQWLLALPVTSKDHDRDAAQEAAAGRHWVDIGSGAWDARGRASEARIDRVVRLSPQAVRRIGARLGRARFDEVTEAMARLGDQSR